ncbi:hypothetical protein [Streptomyces canus]|uniref:hypothetical protein n=1 Tax=Streptomyces canus TaxID=58343 RepID=UPI002789C81A|nr:hypothetical protein [Streptomyces canus]MDQ1072764.1 hypothetical protein [Streptomyces canus]
MQRAAISRPGAVAGLGEGVVQDPDARVEAARAGWASADPAFVGTCTDAVLLPALGV